ncbi:MAG: alpha-glucosidase [Lachnospiraceae bacterium]|nr:alpha-glucosidase [Lachnospiraceae bacterium]
MEKKWWHKQIAYQIYPKSFQDTNGDGIGDLRGIIQHLDYLQKLGIGILWISPVYVSPCADQGYDIADYYQIDPMFGTMEDMEELLKEAKKRDIIVLMDLVVNHCSDEHEWFKKACEDPEGEYGKYFYFAKKENGKLPCNWRSYFGGSVWEPLPGTDWYYYHSFHKKQPDLNWENPKVRQEIYKMMNWWLEKGLGGYRVDAIINIKKPLPFRDFPADRTDGTCDMSVVVNHAKGVGEFLGEMRDETFKKYNAFSVGEVFNEKEEELPDFMGENGYFSTMFDFSQTNEGKSPKGWYDSRIPTVDEYKKCCFNSARKAKGIGMYSNIIENHDEPRGVSYYLPKAGRNDKGKKLLATMYFLLKGIPFVYQGQELGMENMTFADISQIDDISSIAEYEECMRVGLSKEEAMKVVSQYSRDNARTPFQWDDTEHAGFTTGKPWLAVNPNYTRINAKEQEVNPDSVLQYYRKLSHLRRNPEYEDALVYGEVEPYMEEEPGFMAYYRRGEKQDFLIAGNFTEEEKSILINDTKETEVILSNDQIDWKDEKLVIKPFQVVVVRCQKGN